MCHPLCNPHNVQCALQCVVIASSVCALLYHADAIHELAAQYRTSTGIPGLKVQYSSSKGFYLMVPSQHIASTAAGAGITAGGTTGVPPAAAAEVEGEKHPVGGQVPTGSGSRRQWEPQRSVPKLSKCVKCSRCETPHVAGFLCAVVRISHQQPSPCGNVL
jgi:hypothetical protein